MPRTKPAINVTISRDVLSWVDEQVKKKRFASRSHAIEYALHELKKKEK